MSLREKHSSPVEQHPPKPQPWVWLLGLVVLAAWWPYSAYWQSDDFVAVHYAADFSRALGDFGHNQYDLDGLVWFYRPLVTLSFAIDGWLGGADPFVAHLSNAIAHSISALLVQRIALRFLDLERSLYAGLLWGLAPSQIGSIEWAVGRVDSHCCLWIFLSAVLCLRGLEGCRRSRWLAVGAFSLALGCKELAWVTPGVIAVLSVSLCHRQGTQLRAAVIRSLRCTAPFVVLLGLYFVLRYAALGRLIGGYQGGELDIGASVQGLSSIVWKLIDPVVYSKAASLEPSAYSIPESLHWLIILPVAWAAAQVLRRRAYGHLLGCTILFLGCAIPTYQFWAASGNILNLRYFYLSFAALAALLAIGGRSTVILMILLWAPSLVQLRLEYHEQATINRAIHTQILDAADKLEDETLFVSGIPIKSESGHVIAMHLGIDRLLRPPFADSDKKLYALRPLGQQTTVNRLPYGDEIGLPFGATLALTDPSVAVRLPGLDLPDLKLEVSGPTKLDTPTLERLAAGELDLRISTPGLRSEIYRITLFTAGGYLSFFAPDSGIDGSSDGVIELWTQLRTAARYSHDDRPGSLDYTALALEVPTAMDLEPRFPVLIEAGRQTLTGTGLVFEASHANREIFWLQFDHGYGRFLHND